MTARRASPVTSMVSVYDGRTCIGFVLSRGKQGFEAVRVDDVSLGTFTNQRDAVAVLKMEPRLNEPA
jgi:hypothetical protein